MNLKVEVNILIFYTNNRILYNGSKKCTCLEKLNSAENLTDHLVGISSCCGDLRLFTLVGTCLPTLGHKASAKVKFINVL